MTTAPFDPALMRNDRSTRPAADGCDRSRLERTLNTTAAFTTFAITK